MRIDKPARADKTSLRRLWQQAFGDDDAFLDLFFDVAFSYDRCRCVTIDGEIVAALYWFDCTCRGERMAYLYAIATDKEKRGQGLCRALMEDTHAHLASQGYASALLVPAEKSLFDFYERMGYVRGGTICKISVNATPGSLTWHRLTPSEYAARRQTFLPEGGVIQEGEGLDFLARMATFFGGEDFVLATRNEGERLSCIEFLGNLDRAPAIVAALGHEQGHFRTPGAGRAFFMHYPLRENAPVPTYLGIALD